MKKTKKQKKLTLTVNGRPWDTFAHTLSETLGFRGTTVSCDHGACGGCTVLLEGKAVFSCMTLTVECDGQAVTTIEGLSDPKTGKPDPLQQAAGYQVGLALLRR